MILLAFGLVMCEGVDEDSGHEIGHWACRHSSWIMYLLECVCFAMTCALRWRVTHVENYHDCALLTLSRDHYFRYRECIEGRRSLEVAFRRKTDCGFGIFILYFMY